jgi:hypothetical protein
MAAGNGEADYFISYTIADKAWAEWVAGVLESAGYTVTAQFLDFATGDNFVLAMDDALARSRQVMLLLSPAYMKSGFTAAEWSAAFRTDPTGRERRLVPVMVTHFELGGLLGPRVYIPLHGVDEATARQRLLDGLLDPRKVRDADPPFPGGAR